MKRLALFAAAPLAVLMLGAVGTHVASAACLRVAVAGKGFWNAGCTAAGTEYVMARRSNLDFTCAMLLNPATETGEYTEDLCSNTVGQRRWIKVAGITFKLALWLENGASITTTKLVESSGEMLIENEKSTAGKASLQKCSGVLVGSVGANSADEVAEMLSLSGEAISSTPLAGTALKCELGSLCESSSKVWPVDLPWLTEVESWEEEGGSSGFVDLFLPDGKGNPGWYVECKTLLTVSEECTASEGVAEQVNVVSGVESILSKELTELMGAPLALCSGNKEETGVFEGKRLTTIAGGGTLSVSP